MKQEKKLTIAELSELLGVEFKGDGACLITGIAPLHEAQAGDVSFLDNSRYRKYLANTRASVVILSPEFVSECKTNAIVADNPGFSYAKTAELFHRLPVSQTGIHSTAVVGDDCSIDETSSIGPNCVIGNKVSIGKNVIIGAGSVIGDETTIGDDTRIWANVTIYYGVKVGSRVVLHSGVVIGADGFGLANTGNGWRKVPQLGGVAIFDDVEIGANTTVDRGALADTTIEEGVKLDNQIQVGHNVHIGAHTAIAGCVGIAGSAVIGKNCIIGGGAMIAGHITIVDNTMIAGMAGVSKSITNPGVYCGMIPAARREVWNKNAVHFRHLGEMANRLKRLEEIVEEE